MSEKRPVHLGIVTENQAVQAVLQTRLAEVFQSTARQAVVHCLAPEQQDQLANMDAVILDTETARDIRHTLAFYFTASTDSSHQQELWQHFSNLSEYLFMLQGLTPETKPEENAQLFILLTTVVRQLNNERQISENMLTIGNTQLDLTVLNRVRIGSVETAVDPTTFTILKALMIQYLYHFGTPIGVHELSQHFNSQLSDNQVRVYISRARRYLKLINCNLKIVTKGNGRYSLEVENLPQD